MFLIHKNINKTLFLTIISVLFLYIFNENINKYTIKETFKQAPIDYKMGHNNIILKPAVHTSPACNKLYKEPEYIHHKVHLYHYHLIFKSSISNGQLLMAHHTPNANVYICL